MSASNDRLRQLADELPADLAGEIVCIAEALRARRAASEGGAGPTGMTDEDRAWLNADLSRMGEEEPYDWGGADPLACDPVYWDAEAGTLMVGPRP
jgi:hypothetical protein